MPEQIVCSGGWQTVTPKMGEVDGIYSDLLLHDMGQSLSGAGGYNTILKLHDHDTRIPWQSLATVYQNPMKCFPGLRRLGGAPHPRGIHDSRSLSA